MNRKSRVATPRSPDEPRSSQSPIVKSRNTTQGNESPRVLVSSSAGQVSPRSPVSKTSYTNHGGDKKIKDHFPATTPGSAHRNQTHEKTQLPAVNDGRKTTAAKNLRGLISSNKNVSAANFSKLPPLLKLTKIKISFVNGLFCMVKRRLARDIFIRILQSAWLIQCVQRGHVGRSITRRVKTSFYLSAILLRTVAIHQSIGNRRKAIRIQACFKGHKARVRVRLGFTPRWEAAATYIQRRFRGSLVRMVATQLAAVRELPSAMILASMVLQPQPSLFRTEDEELYKKLILQTQKVSQYARKFPKNIQKSDEEIQAIYRAIDKDGDGFLNADDLNAFALLAGFDLLCFAYLMRFNPANNSGRMSKDDFAEAYRQTAQFFRQQQLLIQVTSRYKENEESMAHREFVEKIARTMQKVLLLGPHESGNLILRLDLRIQRQVLRQLSKESLDDILHHMSDQKGLQTMMQHIDNFDKGVDFEEELFKLKMQAEQRISSAHFMQYLSERSPHRHSQMQSRNENVGFSLFHILPHVITLQNAEERAAAVKFSRLEIDAAVREGDMLLEKAMKLLKQGLFKQADEAIESSPVCFEYARSIEEEANLFLNLGSDAAGWEGKFSIAGDTIRIRETPEQHRFLKVLQMRTLLARKKEEASRGPGPVHKAAAKGNIGTVRYLIRKCGESINAIDRIGRTPLHEAVEASHYEVVRIMIEELGVEIDAPTFVGRTALHFAADRGDGKMVQILVESAAYRYHISDTAQASREEITERALAICGASQKTHHGNSVMSLARKRMHLQVTEVLKHLGILDFSGTNEIHAGAGVDVRPDAPFCPALHLNFNDGHLLKSLFEHYESTEELKRMNFALKRPMTASSQNSRPSTTDILAKVLLRPVSKLACDRGNFKLNVGVLSAKAILAADRSGTSDPYVEIVHNSVLLKTKVIPKTLNPVWNETFQLQINSDGGSNWDVLELRLWDQNLISERTFLGVVLIDISDLSFQPTELWYDLQDNGELRNQRMLNPRHRLKFGNICAPPQISGTLCVRLHAVNPVSHLPIPPVSGARELFEQERLYPIHLEHPGLTEGQIRARLAVEWNEGGESLLKKYEEDLSKIHLEFRKSLSPHLLMACARNEIEIVNYCCQHGVDIEVMNDKGLSGLYFAAHKGNTDVVKALLTAGAHVNAQANSGTCPLYQACIHGHVEAARALIDYGANLELAPASGVTALMMCAHRGTLETLDLLLRSGARTEACNDKGATALHLAALAGKAECVAALLRARANPRARITSGELEGQTAKDLARDKETIKAFKTKALR